MQSKSLTLITAIILAVLATLGVVLYLGSLESKIEAGKKKISVYVATKAIKAGKSGNEILSLGLVKKELIPAKFVPKDVVRSESEIKNKTLSTSLSEGEQLTKDKLKLTKAQIGLQIPKGKIGISIPIDEITGVGNQIKSGDKIAIFATFQPDPPAKDETKLILKGIKVLSVSTSKSGAAGASVKTIITILVSPDQAEKLVFAEELGKVWVSLMSHQEKELPNTSGETIDSIFQ
jgi:pilus assembly protein CpaB